MSDKFRKRNAWDFQKRTRRFRVDEPLAAEVAFGDDHGQPLPYGGNWHLPKPRCE